MMSLPTTVGAVLAVAALASLSFDRTSPDADPRELKRASSGVAADPSAMAVKVDASTWTKVNGWNNGPALDGMK